MSGLIPKVKVIAVSDLACPWCYVAYRRLHNALDTYKSRLDVEIQWHPYIIDLNTKPEGEEYLAYNVRRWSGDGWVYDMKRSSKKDGCKFAVWTTWCNSVNAHRMMELARSHSWDMCNRLKGLLFEKYYEEGCNISLVANLIPIGRELGLPGIEDYLNDPSKGRDEVMKADRAAKKKGISGVPDFMIICEEKKLKFHLHGAQSRAAWEEVFQECLDA